MVADAPQPTGVRFAGAERRRQPRAGSDLRRAAAHRTLRNRQREQVQGVVVKPGQKRAAACLDDFLASARRETFG